MALLGETAKIFDTVVPNNWFRLFFTGKEQSSIPFFPHFKKVEISDREAFQSFITTKKLYSDFNFNSFYSWDIHGAHAISQLNGNLVLKFTDYETGEPYLSFTGTNKVSETIQDLKKEAAKENISTSLRLIPHSTIKTLKGTHDFSITEDPKNFDHVFSINKLASLSGNQYKSKRRAAQKCAAEVTVADWSERPEILPAIQALTKEWAQEKLSQGKDNGLETELKATERILIDLLNQPSLRVFVALSGNRLVGYSIDELLPNRYVLSHHAKALPSIPGVSEYLNQKTAQKLSELGYKYWNWEQDLGIPALQRLKQSYRPIQMNKKFTIE